MKKPNILLIHADQFRWDALGANGNRTVKTPNLDKLAKEGVNFDHCFSQNPVCMPSRISLLTGRYCSSLKITHMGVPVPESTETLPVILERYGYHNALIGKLHFLPHANRDHKELHPAYGFHHLELSDEPGCYEDAYRAWVRRKSNDSMDPISLGLPPLAQKWQSIMGMENDGIQHPLRANNHSPGLFEGKSGLTHSAFVGEQTIEYLKTREKKPFFCFSGFYSPHPPLVAPKEFFDLYKDMEMPLPHYSPEINGKRNADYFSDGELRSFTRGYYSAVSEVDHWVGQILKTLEETGAADNTIVVFTSDHGEWLGEHLKYGKGFWAPDVISRVPMVVKVPQSLGGLRETRHDIVECVDIVPTLLRLSGIQSPSKVQGDVLAVSLNMRPDTSDGLALTEHQGWRSLRMEKFRYVIHETLGERLFDLEKDPYEYSDVSTEPSYAEALAESRYRLLMRMLRIEQPHPRTWPY